jgi:hypothetical protein
MTPQRPSPYRLPNLVVHSPEDFLGDRVLVKVCPASQQRIQGYNQVRLSRRLVCLYESSGSAQKADDTLSRGLRQNLAVPVLTYIVPEKVEALFDMSYAGLLLREVQSSDAKKLRNQRLYFVLQQLFRASGDDEVIRISNEIHFGGLAEVPAQFRFKPIQSDVGQRR